MTEGHFAFGEHINTLPGFLYIVCISFGRYIQKVIDNNK